jgi:hypothetical protein
MILWEISSDLCITQANSVSLFGSTEGMYIRSITNIKQLKEQLYWKEMELIEELL